jgi:hypothetical protein
MDLATIAGPAELSTRMVESGKPQRCFAQKFTTFALRREPVPNTGDSCLVQRLGSRTATIADVFKGVALDPNFKQRTVGDP